MNHYIWGYLINPFETATEDSYRLAVKMSKDYLAALNADSSNPQIAPLIPVYKALDTALNTAFGEWMAQGGSQTGDTLEVKLKLKDLSGIFAKAWDVAVQNVFADNTPDYKKLMPNHRIPFQQGTQTLRIAAVQALSTNLTNIAALAGTKTDVDKFLKQLQNSLDDQKTSIKSTGDKSNDVEAARVAACVQIFGDYGNLLSQNAANPLSIGHYFPIKYVRTTDQVFFTHQIKASGIYTVAKHKLIATDHIKITTNTAAGIQIYVAAKKNAPNPGKGGISLSGNSSLTITADQLGNIADDHEIIVMNTDANITADFDLEFL